MRWVLVLLLGACGSSSSDVVDGPTTPDAPHPTADAPVSADGGADAGNTVEDLDMQLADFKNIAGLTQPAGHSYRVANPLGHEAAALAVATSPTGGEYPVGTIIEVQKSEVMVKRRAGFDAVNNNWEWFGINFDQSGTPTSFSTRGAAETDCFTCHSSVSSAKWDYVCEHP